MIKSFQHKGLKSFFETGNTKGIDASHAKRLHTRLAVMNVAAAIEHLDQPGWRLHELKGTREGVWSIHVTKNYRLTFRFVDGDCHIVDYEDYH